MPASTFLYGAHARANGIRQHYLRYGGNGQPLVLVPGIVSPAVLWSKVAERIARSYDVYVVDVRGRGLSESGEHLDHSIEIYAEDLVAFAHILGLHNIILLGHSLGAWISQRACARHSADVEQLVLVDPPMTGPGRRSYPTPLSHILQMLSAARRAELQETLIRLNAPVWPEDLLRLRAEWLHTCDERGVVTSYRELHEEDFHADLANSDLPTALIAASRGGVILPDDEQELQRIRPTLNFMRVPDAGHQVQIDNFEGFLGALGTILKDPI